MDNRENVLYLTHTLGKIYLTGISQVRCLQTSLHNDDNVQTNEHDVQDKTYPIICTHHKLHNTNENKFPVFSGCICNKEQNMMWQTSQIHNHGKYDNNLKGGYFRFDDDNNMSYR